jgi:hypothetical protein
MNGADCSQARRRPRGHRGDRPCGGNGDDAPAAGYGRGSRATALRSARAPTDSPISASSAAACAAMPRMSGAAGWSGPRVAGVGGTPGGCAGCGRRSVLFGAAPPRSLAGRGVRLRCGGAAERGRPAGLLRLFGRVRFRGATPSARSGADEEADLLAGAPLPRGAGVDDRRAVRARPGRAVAAPDFRPCGGAGPAPPGSLAGVALAPPGSSVGVGEASPGSSAGVALAPPGSSVGVGEAPPGPSVGVGEMADGSSAVVGDGPDRSFVGVADPPDGAAQSGASRFWLRRWGRRCGSAPNTADGRSSVTAANDRARARSPLPTGGLNASESAAALGKMRTQLETTQSVLRIDVASTVNAPHSPRTGTANWTALDVAKRPRSKAVRSPEPGRPRVDFIKYSD